MATAVQTEYRLEGSIYPKNESKISLILENINWLNNPNAMIDYLESTLKLGEALNLDQYKYVRELVDSHYHLFVSRGLKKGLLDKQKSEKVGHLFTDFLRYHHYNLLSEYPPGLAIRFPKPKQEVQGFFSNAINFVRGIKNSIEYTLDWHSKDDKMYELERMLLVGQGDFSQERELINELPNFGLSMYKVKTLEMMVPNTAYQSQISSVVSGQEQRQVKRGYFQRLKEIGKGIF